MLALKPHEIRTQRRQQTILISAAGFIVSLGLLTLFWAKYIRPEYFPVLDEFPLLVNSTKFFHPSISSWFLSGYSQYFVSYPEWFVPFTNFLRPVTNAVYYGNSLLFGAHWSYYLLFTYVVQSGIVAVTAYMAREKAELPLVEMLVIGALCLVSPAFGTGAIYVPFYGFDLLAALFVLLGIERVLSRCPLSAWLLFTLAVFTKETALFAPLVAACVVYWDGTGESAARRFLKSAVFLVPLVAWSLLRWHAFSRLGGAYVVKSSAWTDRAWTVLTGFLSWPTGLVTFSWLPGARLYFGGPTNYLLALVNVCFWSVAITACVRALRERKSASAGVPLADTVDQLGLGSRERMAILWFFAGSLGLPIVLDLPMRFAAACFPLFAITLLCVARSAEQKALRIGALVILVLTASVNLRQRIPDTLHTLHSYQAGWVMSRSYIEQISRTQASTLFIVDDASGGFASPESVAKFAHYSGQIVRVDNLDADPNEGHGICADQPNVKLREASPGDFTISSEVAPSCGNYEFTGAQRLKTALGQRSFTRNTPSGQLQYEMPSGLFLLRFGPGKMLVEIHGAPPDSSFLIPDMGSRQYREMIPEVVRH